MKSSKRKIIFLFPGQGSQYRGMGKALFENEPRFRTALTKFDGLVQRLTNRSLLKEIYETAGDFNDLQVTHPAIVSVELAMAELLRSYGILPDHVVGNSLGEFAASSVAGFWPAETAIAASIRQADCVIKNAPAGGMVTVMTAKAEIEDLLANPQLYLASDNFDGHFTLSGKNDVLAQLEKELVRRKINHLRLPVAFPFHSPLMENIYNDEPAFDVLPFGICQDIFVSGMRAKILNSIPTQYFQQISSSYSDFRKVISLTESTGPCVYIDLGPSGTLANFVKYNQSISRESMIFQVMTPFNRDQLNLERLKNFLHPAY